MIRAKKDRFKKKRIRLDGAWDFTPNIPKAQLDLYILAKRSRRSTKLDTVCGRRCQKGTLHLPPSASG